MAVIAGVDSETKQKLIDYCKRNRVTQLEWVIGHLMSDLQAEEERRTALVRSTDLSPVPATVKPE